MLAVSNFVELVGKVAWPLVVACFLLWLTASKTGRDLFTGLVKRIKSIKGPGGLELSLEPEAGEKAKSSLESQFGEFRGEIRKRFDALNHQHNIEQLRDSIVEQVLIPALTIPNAQAQLRCTIYIPDIVFAEALYSLTDYYPSGGGAGAVYSIRFGIIGRQWRLGKSRYEDRIPEGQEELMSVWGMTKAQANTKTQDRAFLVVMLEHECAAQGLLFVSSYQEHPFGSNDLPDSDQHPICEAVRTYEPTHALAGQMALINSEMRARGPALKLFDV